jgi:hypothetical protein
VETLFFQTAKKESTCGIGTQPSRKTQGDRVRRGGAESSRGGVGLLRAVKRQRTPVRWVTPRKSAGVSKTSGATQPSARPKHQALSGGLREPRVNQR